MSGLISLETIVAAAFETSLETLFYLRDDVQVALQRAADEEEEPVRSYLQLLLRNVELAAKDQQPLVHDVGIPIFFVELGEDALLEGPLQNAIDEGVRQALEEYALRPMILKDPMDPESTQTDPTPCSIHIEMVPGDHLKISCMRVSIRSEIAGRSASLRSPFTKDDIIDFVVEAVEDAGLLPCPPLIVGVGIGGSQDRVVTLARKSLLRPVGKPHHRLEYARLEQRLENAINALGIGPGGLGGAHTTLAVQVEVASSQEEAVPLAVHIQGAALRVAERTLATPSESILALDEVPEEEEESIE